MRHIKITAHHLDGNGLCERQIGPIAEALSLFVNVKQNDWDRYFDFVVFAHNSAKLSTTGYSQFLLLLGREPHLPFDTIFKKNDPRTFASSQAYIDELTETLRKAYEVASARTTQQHDRDAHYEDPSRRPVAYQPGNLVRVRDFSRKKGLCSKTLYEV